MIQRRNIRIISKKEQDKLDKNKDFNTFIGEDIKNSILAYGTSIGFFVILYTFTLYKTNKNIDEGFEKVSKIKIEKIEETIKKIENFNVILKKFIDIKSFMTLNNVFNIIHSSLFTLNYNYQGKVRSFF